MEPSSGITNRPPVIFSELEMKACRALFQFQFQFPRRKKPRTWDGLLESLPFSWGVKAPRTQKFHISDCDNKEGEPTNAEETEALTELRKEESPVAFVGSPTSPLLHGSTFMSSQGEPSDSNNGNGPSPTSPHSSPEDLGPKLQFKVETKTELHSSPNSRGPKKKTVAELKQRVNEQLMLKEELEKERKMLVYCHESLMDENKRLKEQLVLKSEGKEEDKLFLCSLYSSQQTMLSHSIINHTSSGPVILPDLNIPLEELSGNSSGDFDNQLFKTDKLVAAAHARKYRVDYLRYLRHKQSQSGNP